MDVGGIGLQYLGADVPNVMDAELERIYQLMIARAQSEDKTHCLVLTMSFETRLERRKRLVVLICRVQEFLLRINVPKFSCS